jgi:hypothetical protein
MAAPSTSKVVPGLALGLSAIGLGAVAILAVVERSERMCPDGRETGWRNELLFGRNIGTDLGVTDEAFDHFVGHEIGPRLANGFTLVEARGQWRDDSGRTIQEPGKLLVVVAERRAEQARLAEALGEIAEAYKARFQQRSVLAITTRACIAF